MFRQETFFNLVFAALHEGTIKVIEHFASGKQIIS